jgi:hypothetical protein
MNAEFSFREMVCQLTGADADEREAARARLLAMDEDAVNPLLDVFYGGVSEAEGLAILDVVAEIGGPDALSMLRNVYHFEEKRKAWQDAAARGLMQNADNLDAGEADEVRGYIERSGVD